jgi:hypothetical protein
MRPGRLNFLVPEPERDHGRVHTGLQQLHGAGMAEYVECDVFSAEGRAALCCAGDVLTQETVDRIGTEKMATSGGQ